jgi:ABC-type bacteriocin/lantibiotic exporter with double-glycine peptidase domain
MYFALRGEGQPMAWLMLYVMATWRMVPSLQNMYRNLARIRFFLPSLQRLAAEFDEPLTSSGNAKPLPLGTGIRLDNVHFTYPASSEETLHGLTLEIPRGSRVALVGLTGSGKTTIADVVAGLLVPDSGSLWVNGEPLTEEHRPGWQRNVGYVPQEIFLSDDTVAANIGLGIASYQLDQEAVERAASAAHIHDFVAELPLGYASPLGERGASMSGGQRQRIGIARALYHGPELLIFDEATSALDEVTQRKVLESLESLSHELTVLVIAHRLDVVRNCDQICLLSGGRMVAAGTYTELMENCPEFHAFVQGDSSD